MFLAEPEEYDDGKLTIEHKYGTQEVKLRAGDLVLYPSLCDGIYDNRIRYWADA